MEYFDFVKAVKYEGPASKNPYAFKFYNADEVILGKKMSEHLPFAMAWWHNLGANGVDMFGRGTIDKSFGATPNTLEHAKAKVDAGFEFMTLSGGLSPGMRTDMETMLRHIGRALCENAFLKQLSILLS